MIPVDAETMFEVAPRFSGAKAEGQGAIIRAVGPVLAATLEDYDITTRLRIAHFLGQTCHESAGFRTTEEFASGDQYEGRADLGNDQPGDGRRFKGRGLIQLTGRANYRKVGKKLKLDLEGNPLMAAEPVLSLRIACEYWKDRKINLPADGDNLVQVTLKINGGTNGLDDRRVLTQRAKAAVARLEGVQLSGGAAPGARPILRRGSRGAIVAELQAALRVLGFPVSIDEDFGPATELAVMRFQMDSKLDVDGVVGPATWTALDKAAK